MTWGQRVQIVVNFAAAMQHEEQGGLTPDHDPCSVERDMDPDCERLIALLNREELKHALDVFGVTCSDRRIPTKMECALIRCRAVSTESLLCLVDRARERHLRAILRSTKNTPVPVAAESLLSPRNRLKNDSVTHLDRPFVAIDFETADHGRDSACAVGAVRVEGDRIVGRVARLIRPPRRVFAFTYIHGIRWSDVAAEPAFGAVWSDVMSLLKGAAFLAAHNASFDRGVLKACCQSAGIALPALPVECTVGWARRTWGIYPTDLAAVCRRLDLPLRHHDAASDAEACARIMIAIRGERLGYRR